MGKGGKNKSTKSNAKKKAGSSTGLHIETSPTIPYVDAALTSASVSGSNRRRSISLEPQSDIATPPVFATPPTSPLNYSLDLLPSPPPEIDQLLEPTPNSIISELELVEVEPVTPEPVASTSSTTALPPPVSNDVPVVTATDIMANNQEIAAIAELFSTMKKALGSMNGAFDKLEGQSEKMMSHGLDLQATQQLKELRATLQTQIQRQRLEVDEVRRLLESRVKAAIQAAIKERMREMVRQALRDIVKVKVRDELSHQLPEGLRQQVISHQRQILEVKTTLHNSEARRYNSLQTSTTANARLRPLLRPLPTPEQSPVYAPPISRSSSIRTNAQSTMPTPASTLSSMNSHLPSVPAPTPIKRSVSNPFTPSVTWTREPPTASTFFPPDLKSLFSLGPEDTRRLLREYGLASATATPALERPPKERALPSVDEESGSPGSDSDAEIYISIKKGKQKESDTEDEEDPEAHAADMNKFMAHIGVPFLMVPAPKDKGERVSTVSSNSRRRSLLTPLIIK
ncbi:hypothetical protein CPB83DRAFT_857595 [Crepidotus variabilis]|uniref:Uncharacterized protein n=1 Tax=Crepidotus variabilis TaxID=179855 RepID=A0A9P6JNC3_9AGAR|nr:hypothetical protein CPB83DRAFT_857595 [Crepidotus variabilis]